MPTILVDINPDGESCRECNLLIFDDMGTPPYCAAGHRVVWTRKTSCHYPDRPDNCKSKEVWSEALTDQLRQKQAQVVMPLIGPLLDAWDGITQDAKGDWEDFAAIIQAIEAGMEDGDEA